MKLYCQPLTTLVKTVDICTIFALYVFNAYNLPSISSIQINLSIHLSGDEQYCICLCFQSPDGRVEVRGRHGESMLTIVGVGLSDWGRFDCEALSRIGGHQKSMFLDIECECILLIAASHMSTCTSTCSDTNISLCCHGMAMCLSIFHHLSSPP